MQTSSTTSLFGLRDRPYFATCKHVQSQLVQLKDSDPDERCNLKLILHDISPSDLRDSHLLHAAFVEESSGTQATIESVDEDPERAAEALYNARFKVLQGTELRRVDMNAGYKLQIITPGGALDEVIDDIDGGTLRPFSGIDLKSIVPAEASRDGAPLVNLIIMVKGLGYEAAGYGWLISDMFLRFVPKNQQECNEDAARQRAEKAHPGQQDLAVDGDLEGETLPESDDWDEEEGRSTFAAMMPSAGDEAEPDDESADAAAVTFGDFTPGEFNELPPGCMVTGKFSSYIKRDQGGTPWESQQRKGSMFSSAELVDKHVDEALTIHPASADQILPEWAEQLVYAQTHGEEE